MKTVLPNFLVLLARICLSHIFLLSAVNHLMNWRGTVEYMSKQIAERSPFGGVAPVVVQLMLAGAVILMLVGGLSVLLGLYARGGAVLLMLFLIPAALLFHNFWVYNSADPQRMVQMANFMKNIGIVGGQLMLLVFGAGQWSIDAALTKHPKE